MSIELRVSTGARAGHWASFDTAPIGIGRHPQSELQLDGDRDLDVSARHAEIISREGHFELRDVGSTNGTFVNGVRVASPRELRDGDVITLGPDGPRIIVGLSHGAAPAPTRISAPRAATQTTGGKGGRAAVAAGLVAVLGLGAAYWLGARESRAQAASVDALTRHADSLRAVYDRDVGTLSGRLAGLDSALLRARAESEALRSSLRGEVGAGAGASSGSTALEQAERRHQAILTATAVDYPSIAGANGGAVVLIAVEMTDGRSFTGSGFGVSEDGLVVTNRHLLESPDGATVRRIAVIYSDTRAWLPARVVRRSSADDLALLRVERRGPFPVVERLGRAAAAPGVGAPVAIIGYPLGVETPMDGSSDRITARATLGAGMVSKVADGVVQIDAFAGEGSSGSPVFDGTGAVVGVVYGGARASGGRIVYAVPGDRVAVLLQDALPGAGR